MNKLSKKELLFYAITDRNWLHGEKLTEVVRKALHGGVTCIQLREKYSTETDFLKEAIEIKKITEQYHVPLIINDNVTIAVKVDANGVHIGQKDISAIKAKEILGKKRTIGITTRTVEQALIAQKNDATYLGCGAAFATQTKQDAIPMTEKIMKEICQSVEIPVVAIGGITYENMEQLQGRGITGIAVISSLFAAEDIYRQAVKMRKKAEELFIKSI